MLTKRFRPEDPSSVIYWNQCYFETNVVARKVRAPKGEPAIIQKALRGIYMKISEDKRKKPNTRNQVSVQSPITPISTNIQYTKDLPIIKTGGKVNCVGVCMAITGTEILMVHTQYRHYSAVDVYHFFQDLLQLLQQKYSNKSFTFFGDNLGL